LNLDLLSLLQNEESPILEFKRQWYWGDNLDDSDLTNMWGELQKDIISLANGYPGFVGQDRFIIFGYSENESKVYSFDNKVIKHLTNLKQFKKQLIGKLESLTKPALVSLDIELITIDDGSLLVIKIPSPVSVTELKKQLQTKTRHLDEGAVLVRKGQKTDEVRSAAPDEINDLKREFEQYKGSVLFKRMNPPDQEPKLERTIEKTVQSYIDKNTSLSIATGYPKKAKNWDDGIIYEIYKLVDSFNGQREFIYIHDLAVQGKTLAHIKKATLINDFKNTIILIDRPKNIDSAKRKNNIKKLFKSDHIYFIDEFGYNFLYKDCIHPFMKFNLPVYVDSLFIDEGKDNSALERLISWHNSDNEPLFVVSGHGGIGKTTLAKQFLDYVYDESDEPGILFIDSKEIIHELSRKFSHKNKINDVFDFYSALMDVGIQEMSKFDKELLKLSIDNGSLLVVLDGIDEVIAKLGDKFDVESFITSIFEEYSSDLHKTKILITCRDHFWNDISKNIVLPEITLRAFNKSLATDFFNQKHDSDQKKVTKSLQMANNLAIDTTSSINSKTSESYIPFLLDMISYLINRKSEEASNDFFDSSYLSNKDNTDILVGQICKREISKLESLSLDDQIILFINMASNKESRISVYDIKSELLNLTTHVDDALIDKVKGHPLMIFSENHFSFRYDVFEIYFKSLKIVYLLKLKNITLFDEDCANIFSGYLKYDSSFTKSVSNKIIYDDNLLEFCSELMIFSHDLNKVNRELFISSIVCLLLQNSVYNADISSRTLLIESLFLENDEINGLCLVDIFGASGVKPKFDFRGKKLTNCHFNNYEYFLECSFDKDTRFTYSYFNSINPRAGIKYNLPEDVFSVGCDTNEIDNLLNKKKEEVKNTNEIIRIKLLKVFQLFYARQNFYPRKQEEVGKKLASLNLLQDLISKGVIVNYIDKKKPTMRQFKVHDDYRSIINLIDQETPSDELDQLVKEFS
jgi:hypothetical protein